MGISKLNKNKNILIIFSIILFLIIIYFYLIYPLPNINTLQNTVFNNKWWEIIMLGYKNKKYLNKIHNNKTIKNDSVWYQFQIIKSNNLFLTIYLKNFNKFSNLMELLVNIYSFSDNKKYSYNFDIDYNLLTINKIPGGIIIDYTQDCFYRTIFNMEKNEIHTKIMGKNLYLEIIQDILFNRTVQLDHLKRYEYSIHNMLKIFKNGIYLSNQLKGNIKYFRFNNSIENNGSTYFETGYGFNKYHFSRYIWHVLLGKEWIFWYTDHANYKWVYCANKITKKIIYCGVVDFKLYNKIKSNIETEKDGNVKFNFEMVDLNFKIYIKSINEPHNKMFFDPIYFHKNKYPLKINNNEIEYYNKIKKYKFIDYCNYSNIIIIDNNKKIEFSEWVYTQVVY